LQLVSACHLVLQHAALYFSMPLCTSACRFVLQHLPVCVNMPLSTSTCRLVLHIPTCKQCRLHTGRACHLLLLRCCTCAVIQHLLTYALSPSDLDGYRSSQTAHYEGQILNITFLSAARKRSMTAILTLFKLGLLIKIIEIYSRAKPVQLTCFPTALSV
jgi:hypothetical protein